MGCATYPKICLRAALAIPLAAVFLCPTLLHAQASVTLVEPPAPLLPKQFGAWQQAPADGASPVSSIDNAAEPILKEDGVTRFSKSDYKRDASAETLTLQAYQFGDATGAFSAFTYFRTPEDRPVAGANLGTSATQNGDRVLIWNGPSVVLAEFHGGRRVADLSALIVGLPKVGGPKGYPPLLPTLLPAKGFQAETLRYALGPQGYRAMGGVLPPEIVGFDKSAEVVTAKYAGRGTLTLLLYPTPQIAGDHGREIEAEMNREVASGNRETPGTVKLRREGPLMLMTSGVWPAAEAQQLVENIHLRSEVTWNKPVPPEFHVEVRKTASLLFTIVELSIVLMLAATVLGLFFGGGRAMIRILQGKPAASEPEFLRIDLRDRPGESGNFKPLH